MTDFQYAGEYASDHQLEVCSFDNVSGVSAAESGSQLSAEQARIAGTDEFIITDNSYGSPMSFTFQACKLDNGGAPTQITPEEFSSINRWVNRKDSHRFKINKTGYEDIYFMGRFNTKALKVNGSIFGVEFTFISDFPYGFSDEITQKFSGNEFMVYNHSDETGVLYPFTVIRCNEGGTLRITNSTDNEIFQLTDCSAGEIITIDNKNMVITSNRPDHRIQDCFNFNYLKLCNTYDERRNTFVSTLDIDMEIRYSPVRKVGI